MPGHDWVWLKAQCYQESLLNPNAVSYRGAKGLCQFMDATWEEETSELRLRASPFNPVASALVSAKYNSKLIRTWERYQGLQDLLQFAQASYNAGIGNMRKFFSTCPHPVVTWADMIQCVPFRETREYVTRIQKHYDGMTSEREYTN